MAERRPRKLQGHLLARAVLFFVWIAALIALIHWGG